jgi:ribose 5-phosphate isomerase B
MRIAIGCDKLGLELKEEVKNRLSANGHTVEDFGINESEDIDYPVIGEKVARIVANREAERGILICGTGIGMEITANKIKGAYAAVCHDLYSTQRSILSNNANIMCLGAGVIGKSTALALLDVWMSLSFIEGASSRKIAKIKEIEKKQ